jgi:hypothetical protein
MKLFNITITYYIWTFKIRSVKLTAAFSSLFTSKARDLSFLRRCRWLRPSTLRRINARRPFHSFRRPRNTDKCKMVRKTAFSSLIIMLKKTLSQHRQMQNGKKTVFSSFISPYYVEERIILLKKTL